MQQSLRIHVTEHASLFIIVQSCPYLITDLEKKTILPKKSSIGGFSAANILFFHIVNNNFEKLKVKDFQHPLPSNSKTFKALFGFQGLSRSQKKWTMFFTNFQRLVAAILTLEIYNQETVNRIKYDE